MKNIKIVRGNVFSNIFPLNHPQYIELSNLLAVEVIPKNKLFFIKKNKPWMKDWDGKYRFLKYPDQTFLQGLTEFLISNLNEKDWNISVIDDSSKYAIPENIIDNLNEDFLGNGVKFRDYQLSIIKDALKHRKCLIPASVNAGKTEIFVGISKVILDYARKHFKSDYTKSRVLYIVPSAELLHQTIDRFNKRLNKSYKVTGFGAGIFDVSGDIVISTASMLYSRLKSGANDKDLLPFFKDAFVFIGDEFHKGSSYSWQQISEMTEAPYRFGGSGTLESNRKADQEKVMKRIGAIGPLIEGIKNDFMIAEGYSAKPKILMHDLKDYENQYNSLPYSYIPMSAAIWHDGKNFNDVLFVRKETIEKTDDKGRVCFDKDNNPILEKTGKSVIRLKNGEFISVDPNTMLNKKHAYDFCVCMFEPRNKIIVESVQKSLNLNHKCLISVTKTAHGKLLEELVTQSGVSTKFLYGGNSIEERMEWLGKLKQGEIKVLIASSIFNVGIDVPDFHTIINAAGMKAYIDLIQRLGRGLRKKEKDNSLTYIDFVDAQNTYTMEHSIVRVEEYEKQKFDIEFA